MSRKEYEDLERESSKQSIFEKQQALARFSEKLKTLSASLDSQTGFINLAAGLLFPDLNDLQKNPMAFDSLRLLDDRRAIAAEKSATQKLTKSAKNTWAAQDCVERGKFAVQLLLAVNRKNNRNARDEFLFRAAEQMQPDLKKATQRLRAVQYLQTAWPWQEKYDALLLERPTTHKSFLRKLAEKAGIQDDDREDVGFLRDVFLKAGTPGGFHDQVAIDTKKYYRDQIKVLNLSYQKEAIDDWLNELKQNFELAKAKQDSNADEIQKAYEKYFYALTCAIEYEKPSVQLVSAEELESYIAEFKSKPVNDREAILKAKLSDEPVLSFAKQTVAGLTEKDNSDLKEIIAPQLESHLDLQELSDQIAIESQFAQPDENTVSEPVSDALLSDAAGSTRDITRSSVVSATVGESNLIDDFKLFFDDALALCSAADLAIFSEELRIRKIIAERELETYEEIKESVLSNQNEKSEAQKGIDKYASEIALLKKYQEKISAAMLWHLERASKARSKTIGYSSYPASYYAKKINRALPIEFPLPEWAQDDRTLPQNNLMAHLDSDEAGSSKSLKMKIDLIADKCRVNNVDVRADENIASIFIKHIAECGFVETQQESLGSRFNLMGGKLHFEESPQRLYPLSLPAEVLALIPAKKEKESFIERNFRFENWPNYRFNANKIFSAEMMEFSFALEKLNLIKKQIDAKSGITDLVREDLLQKFHLVKKEVDLHLLKLDRFCQHEIGNFTRVSTGEKGKSRQLIKAFQTIVDKEKSSLNELCQKVAVTYQNKLLEDQELKNQTRDQEPTYALSITGQQYHQASQQLTFLGVKVDTKINLLDYFLTQLIHHATDYIIQIPDVENAYQLTDRYSKLVDFCLQYSSGAEREAIKVISDLITHKISISDLTLSGESEYREWLNGKRFLKGHRNADEIFKTPKSQNTKTAQLARAIELIDSRVSYEGKPSGRHAWLKKIDSVYLENLVISNQVREFITKGIAPHAHRERTATPVITEPLINDVKQKLIDHINGIPNENPNGLLDWLLQRDRNRTIVGSVLQAMKDALGKPGSWDGLTSYPHIALLKTLEKRASDSEKHIIRDILISAGKERVKYLKDNLNELSQINPSDIFILRRVKEVDPTITETLFQNILRLSTEDELVPFARFVQYMANVEQRANYAKKIIGLMVPKILESNERLHELTQTLGKLKDSVTEQKDQYLLLTILERLEVGKKFKLELDKNKERFSQPEHSAELELQEIALQDLRKTTERLIQNLSPGSSKILSELQKAEKALSDEQAKADAYRALPGEAILIALECGNDRKSKEQLDWKLTNDIASEISRNFSQGIERTDYNSHDKWQRISQRLSVIESIAMLDTDELQEAFWYDFIQENACSRDSIQRHNCLNAISAHGNHFAKTEMMVVSLDYALENNESLEQIWSSGLYLIDEESPRDQEKLNELATAIFGYVSSMSDGRLNSEQILRLYCLTDRHGLLDSKDLQLFRQKMLLHLLEKGDREILENFLEYVSISETTEDNINPFDLPTANSPVNTSTDDLGTTLISLLKTPEAPIDLTLAKQVVIDWQLGRVNGSTNLSNLNRALTEAKLKQAYSWFRSVLNKPAIFSANDPIQQLNLDLIKIKFKDPFALSREEALRKTMLTDSGYQKFKEELFKHLDVVIFDHPSVITVFWDILTALDKAENNSVLDQENRAKAKVMKAITDVVVLTQSPRQFENAGKITDAFRDLKKISHESSTDAAKQIILKSYNNLFLRFEMMAREWVDDVGSESQKIMQAKRFVELLLLNLSGNVPDAVMQNKAYQFLVDNLPKMFESDRNNVDEIFQKYMRIIEQSSFNEVDITEIQLLAMALPKEKLKRLFNNINDVIDRIPSEDSRSAALLAMRDLLQSDPKSRFTAGAERYEKAVQTLKGYSLAIADIRSVANAWCEQAVAMLAAPRELEEKEGSVFQSLAEKFSYLDDQHKQTLIAQLKLLDANKFLNGSIPESFMRSVSVLLNITNPFISGKKSELITVARKVLDSSFFWSAQAINGSNNSEEKKHFETRVLSALDMVENFSGKKDGAQYLAKIKSQLYPIVLEHIAKNQVTETFNHDLVAALFQRSGIDTRHLCDEHGKFDREKCQAALAKVSLADQKIAIIHDFVSKGVGVAEERQHALQMQMLSQAEKASIAFLRAEPLDINSENKIFIGRQVYIAELVRNMKIEEAFFQLDCLKAQRPNMDLSIIIESLSKLTGNQSLSVIENNFNGVKAAIDAIHINFQSALKEAVNNVFNYEEFTKIGLNLVDSNGNFRPDDTFAESKLGSENYKKYQAAKLLADNLAKATDLEKSVELIDCLQKIAQATGKTESPYQFTGTKFQNLARIAKDKVDGVLEGFARPIRLGGESVARLHAVYQEHFSVKAEGELEVSTSPVVTMEVQPDPTERIDSVVANQRPSLASTSISWQDQVIDLARKGKFSEALSVLGSHQHGASPADYSAFKISGLFSDRNRERSYDDVRKRLEFYVNANAQQLEIIDQYKKGNMSDALKKLQTLKDFYDKNGILANFPKIMEDLKLSAQVNDRFPDADYQQICASLVRKVPQQNSVSGPIPSLSSNDQYVETRYVASMLGGITHKEYESESRIHILGGLIGLTGEGVDYSGTSPEFSEFQAGLNIAKARFDSQALPKKPLIIDYAFYDGARRHFTRLSVEVASDKVRIFSTDSKYLDAASREAVGGLYPGFKSGIENVVHTVFPNTSFEYHATQQQQDQNTCADRTLIDLFCQYDQSKLIEYLNAFEHRANPALAINAENLNAHLTGLLSKDNESRLRAFTTFLYQQNPVAAMVAAASEDASVIDTSTRSISGASTPRVVSQAAHPAVEQRQQEPDSELENQKRQAIGKLDLVWQKLLDYKTLRNVPGQDPANFVLPKGVADRKKYSGGSEAKYDAISEVGDILRLARAQISRSNSSEVLDSKRVAIIQKLGEISAAIGKGTFSHEFHDKIDAAKKVLSAMKSTMRPVYQQGFFSGVPGSGIGRAVPRKEAAKPKEETGSKIKAPGE